MRLKGLKKAMSQRIAASPDLLCVISILMAAGFLPGVILAPQPLAGGANLFALSRQAGEEIDAARALSLTQFYATEAPKTETATGALVRSETATDYVLPPGITAARILYHTRTANNVDAIASAVVLAPYGQPPAGGWPLLAWSHGTSGVVRECAPSRVKLLFYNWEGLYEYVLMGYAVVATDLSFLRQLGGRAP